MATPHTIRRFPECLIVDIGALSVGPPPVEAEGDRNVEEIGVPNKYRAGQFICRLWVTDKKGNKHLATCLCDTGGEVNLQSETFLPDECVDTSLHPVNLEGVSGHALPGGNTGSFLKAHMVAQDLWEEGKVEDVVSEDYFYRAAIKYDLYLGHPFLTKNKVAPVGHRRCFILESGEQEAPSFRFLHSWYRNAKEFFSRRVNTVFGEDEGISEINATTAYSILLQEQRRDTQRPKPRNWKSSNYRVVDKWRDYICSYFLENHDFVPAKDAFRNELNKRFKCLADDAWAVKWDKRLWINPPFHLLGEVVQKIKEDRTQAILVVPLWDWKPWWKDVLAMTVDSIHLPHDVKLYATNDTGPLRQRPWPSVAFLVDGGLISDGSCTSDHGSESGLDYGTGSDSNFSDFLEGDDTVPNLESERLIVVRPQYDQIQQASPTWSREKNSERRSNSDNFTKNPSLRPFWTPLSVRMWKMLSRFGHPRHTRKRESIPHCFSR